MPVDSLPWIDPRDAHDARASFAALCFAIARRERPEAVPELLRDLWLDAPPDPTAIDAVTLRAPPTLAPCLLVPGLLGDTVRHVVAPMEGARRALAPDGYRVEVAWVNGRSGSSDNAALLRERVLEAVERHGEPLHLIGYSKGCTDALHLLADHPDTHAAIRSLTSLAGVVHGTPLAIGTPELLERWLRRVPLPGKGPGDGRAIDDLEPVFRAAHLAAHPPPDDIRYASVVAAPGIDRVSRVLRSSYRRLSRIDAANDSQVIARDAILPNGELLAVLNADHWAVALPIAAPDSGWRRWLGRWLITRNACARDILLAAILQRQQQPPPDGPQPSPG